MAKSNGLYPKHKHKREHKMKAFRKALKEHENSRNETYFYSIDKILSKFLLKEDLQLRTLREEYIRFLLIAEEIKPQLFEGSKLISQKFLTRCKP